MQRFGGGPLPSALTTEDRWCSPPRGGANCETWVGAELGLSSPVLDPVLRQGQDVVVPRLRLSVAGRSLVVSAVVMPVRLSARSRGALLVARARGHRATGSLNTALLARLCVRNDFAISSAQTRRG